MMGGTVWSSDALWNGVTLLNDAAVGVYGMILSAAFCGITWTRGKKWAYGLSMAAILLAQAAVYGMTTDLQLLKLLYPLVTHMPLVLVLAIIERKLLWPTISVLTAYLCCQLRRWLALLLTALMSGGGGGADRGGAGADAAAAAGAAVLCGACRADNRGL